MLLFICCIWMHPCKRNREKERLWKDEEGREGERGRRGNISKISKHNIRYWYTMLWHISRTCWYYLFLFYIKVHITDESNYQNKICYSHVDPHMRTADGKYVYLLSPSLSNLCISIKYKEYKANKMLDIFSSKTNYNLLK